MDRLAQRRATLAIVEIFFIKFSFKGLDFLTTTRRRDNLKVTQCSIYIQKRILIELDEVTFSY